MPHYVYTLKSLASDKHYVGVTTNLDRRLYFENTAENCTNHIIDRFINSLQPIRG